MSARDRRRTDPDANRRVTALPRAKNVRDSIGHLAAAVGNSQVRGVIVVMVDHEGRVDTRTFGDLLTREMCWAGAFLQHAALSDE